MFGVNVLAYNYLPTLCFQVTEVWYCFFLPQLLLIFEILFLLVDLLSFRLHLLHCDCYISFT